MVEKTKAWILSEYNMIEKWFGSDCCDVSAAITRSYGVMMFVSNELLGYDTPEGYELATWWDDEMLPKFRQLL